MYFYNLTYFYINDFHNYNFHAQTSVIFWRAAVSSHYSMTADPRTAMTTVQVGDPLGDDFGWRHEALVSIIPDRFLAPTLAHLWCWMPQLRPSGRMDTRRAVNRGPPVEYRNKAWPHDIAYAGPFGHVCHINLAWTTACALHIVNSAWPHAAERNAAAKCSWDIGPLCNSWQNCIFKILLENETKKST